MINPVTIKWRKVIDTPWPKRQVVWIKCFNLTLLIPYERPGNSESLKVLVLQLSTKYNTVNPANPIWKDRVEDFGKSECHSVIKWIEEYVEKHFLYSTGNSADFQMVLVVDKPECNFYSRSC